MRLPALLLLLVTGCPDNETDVFVNEGVVCLRGEGADDALASSTDLSVRVRLTCVSSCATDVESSCAAELRGDVLTVESRFEYQTRFHGNACPAVCGILDTTCTLPALPAGNYTLRHGPSDYPLEVSADTAATCVGEGD